MKESIEKCQVVGVPTSYDLPVHPFFLTSYHTVVKNDITVYTVLSIDRLGRLIEMVDNWKGPVSAAISITSIDEIPIIVEAWMGNEIMRKYVDIHLVFDDQVTFFLKQTLLNIMINLKIFFALTLNLFFLHIFTFKDPIDVYS